MSYDKEASTHVRCTVSYDIIDILGSPIFPGSIKLVILNVHGTLLDYILLIERNPTLNQTIN
jgi:hypothetical protein